MDRRAIALHLRLRDGLNRIDPVLQHPREHLARVTGVSESPGHAERAYHHDARSRLANEIECQCDNQTHYAEADHDRTYRADCVHEARSLWFWRDIGLS